MGRARDLELAKHYRSLACSIADKYCHGNSEGDHIKSWGSGGEDCHENLWPLCRFHHVEKHTCGLTEFVKRYPKLQNVLKAKGFSQCDFTKKWIRLTEKGWDAD